MYLPVAGLGWLLGLVAVDAWSAAPLMAAAWFVALMPVGLLVAGRRGAITVGVAAALALLAGLHAEPQRAPDPGSLADFFGSEVELTGTITSAPDPGLTRVSYRLQAEQIILGDETIPASAGILVNVNQYLEFLPGDRVRVRGKLEQPASAGQFDYRERLAQRDAVASMYATTAERLREGGWSFRRMTTTWRLKLERAMQRSLPEPEASLAAGIAFGRDEGLSREVAQEFRDTGLAHLTAVSGGNIVLIVALAFFATQAWFSRNIALVTAAASIALYVALAGASGSVIRAGIMAAVFLSGEALGRPQSGLAALAAAAVLMTLVDPSLIHDVGFQLSATSTASLITFGPRCRHAAELALRRLRLTWVFPGLVLQAVVLSFLATVGTLPVVMSTFGRVSLAGLALNALVEPIFALAFYASLLTGAAGVAWRPLGEFAGLVSYYPLAFVTKVAHEGSRLPFAAVGVPATGTGPTLAAYGLLATLGWFAFRRHPEERPRPRPPAHAHDLRLAAYLAGASAMSLAVVAVSLEPMNGPGRLTVTFLDVGQGDAILVTTPHGRHVLIDSGPSGIELARELGAVLPHWDRTIDVAILTHPQEDHVGGFPYLLERYHVAAVVDNGKPSNTLTSSLFRRPRTTGRALRAGTAWQADGVRFEVLWPPTDAFEANLNDASIVLRISYGERTFLLTGDIEAPAQRALISSGAARADVLKVPHHGSKTSDPAFFSAVSPRVAVISSGAGNRYGHPAADTLAALEGLPLMRTDLDGRVTVSTDGRDLRVLTER